MYQFNKGKESQIREKWGTAWGKHPGETSCIVQRRLFHSSGEKFTDSLAESSGILTGTGTDVPIRLCELAIGSL
jgi:hypothetical protein